MSKRRLTRKLLATGLSLSALAQLVPPPAPVQAQALTPAGTVINNRATGTFEDPNNPGVVINATSNQVVVTVAEVAGLTNVPAGIIDRNAGSVSTGDILDFDFLVTNTGNNPTNIHFPAIADIPTVGIDRATLRYQLDLNNDGVFAGPAETELRTLAFTTATPIPAGASVRVRVTGTVNAMGSGQVVSVRLGDTGNNDNTPGTQNQSSTGLAADVRTVDVAAPAPVNGEREASAIQSTNVALAVNRQALATILKTRTAHTPNTAALTDDVLTYGLSLRVENSPGNIPGVTPVGLAPTVNVNIDGTNRNVILISDAIPANTRLNAVPTAPTGWRIVYSTAPVGTTLALTPTATSALWTTAAPADLGTVTRIGFVYDPDTNIVTDSPAIAPGTTFTGFSFSVVTSQLTAIGGTIANIAQVFGRSDGTNIEVYDESGDQRPSNFNDDGTPGPGANNGVADPAAQGTDANNDNTGTGAGGEVNIFVITPPGAILNGPRNVPGAVGPTNNNDDFTNRSATPPAGNLDAFNPDPIVFNNTFQNPSTNLTRQDNVRLLPLAPIDPTVPANSRQPNADIPNGTRVTITLGTQIAVYDYADGVYTFNAGLSSGLPMGSTSVLVNGVNPGVSVNYTVTVDLPAGTPQSAVRFAGIADPVEAQRRAGFNVPIVAFIDQDGNGLFQPANDAVNNVTINRSYTGYVRLRKQSQIIRENVAVTPLDEAAKDVRPGDIIRFVVEYVNFSTPSVGVGNVTLDASNLRIIENGSAFGNTWGANTVHFNSATPTTGPVPNLPQNTFATQGTITFNGATIPDPATGTPVNEYVNNVGTIAPTTTPATFQGLFRFHRRVN